MIVDYHNHTTLCHHATGTMDEYVEQAITSGAGEFGFSEHSPWMIQLPEEPLAMSYDEVPIYVEHVQELAQRHKSSITIRLGIEVDYVPSQMEIARQHLAAYPFDYHIGSIHHLDDWGFDNPAEIHGFEERPLQEIYNQYFSLMREMVKTGLIDIVGHFDLPKKFGHRLEGVKGIDDIIDETLQTIEESGTAVEINLAGWDKPIGEPYPSLSIIKKLHARRIPITLGSDAHSPEAVGLHYSRILSILNEIGVKHLMAFFGRDRKLVEI